MSDRPTPPPSADSDLPPKLADVLSRMSLRGPVVELTSGRSVAEDGRITTDQRSEPVLPSHTDWERNERPATAADMACAEGTAARIRGEVAEIRTAAERLAAGSPFEAAVGDFLRVQAAVLERNGGTIQQAENLSRGEDTREDPGMLATPARCALLIARAHLAQE